MLKNKVKEYRQAKQISKANLAREIGVCRSYVTKLERGGLQPSGEVMFRIAAYFKGRIEDIFERVGGKPTRQHFFDTKSLPNVNTISKFLISPGQAGVQPTGHSARPSSGNGAVKDKSLVDPTAKVVASPVALASQRKIT
jgi:DNA-binding XRE family transcriptional regulator